MSTSTTRRLNSSVFIPAFAIVLIAVAVGLINNELLVKFAKDIFYFSLSDFGWLYQLLAISTLAVVGFIFFSKAGNIRLGGAHAKPKFSMASTFALSMWVLSISPYREICVSSQKPTAKPK
jgi:choline-glycine betaine transporter